MIQLNDLSLRRGKKQLLEHADFTLHHGQRVGLIGANGVGKSSLFALILGQLECDGGELLLPANATIAHVAQETPALDRSALDYVLDGDRELRSLEAELAELEASAEPINSAERIAHIHATLDAISGYSAPSRAAQLLSGLGFHHDEIEKPTRAFSGGWRMRLNLAQALMCRSDILLLDEPTNHLDIEAILWLESWLKRYKGTLLLISHDRQFLDRVVTQIVHIAQQQATLYTGNYSDFEEQRSMRLAQQQQAYEKQQREMAHMQSFIDRFRAKATKAKQAQSRIKALERMTRITPAHIDSPFTFQFKPVGTLPTTLLTVAEANIGFEPRSEPLLKQVNINIGAQARIGLLGRNGAGKSTLIKVLAHHAIAQSTPNTQSNQRGPLCLQGHITPAKPLKIGYFAQHQLEHLDDQASALTHLTRLDPKASEQKLRDFLGGFAFHGEMATSPIQPFSGGEKARLSLALIIYQKPNLLLLDEPTNHLDLEMRHALTLALQGFEGAMLLVSHDRHLLENSCDQFWLVADQNVTPFEGDLEDYYRWLLDEHQTSDSEPCSNEPTPDNSSKKAQRQQAAEQRRQMQPLKKEIEALEKEMEQLQQAHAEVQDQLADTSLYEAEQRDTLKALLKQESDLKQTLEANEEAWLAANEALEALQNRLS